MSEGNAVQEGRYTAHEMRVQKQRPIYRSVDEQVFLAAQAMKTNPRGVAVIGVEDRKPALCAFPKMDKRPVK